MEYADLVVVLCLISASSLPGCSQTTLRAPQSLRRVQIETRAQPQKPQRELPPLIAPPPAYGNKIVMAQRAPLTSSN